MADSFFKAVIRDPKWDVRSEAKRLGFLFQLYIDSKKPTEVFIKYKTAKEAAKARASLAQNENVLRVESMDEWNIKPKKQESKQPEHNASAAPSVVGSTVQTRSPAKHNSAASNHMPPPMPMQMPMQMQMPMGPPGMFSVCAACRNSGASFQCFVCGIFYCGDQCQRADWPAHIMQCVPRLVRATNPFVAANVPQRSMPLAFNGMFPGAGNNNWYENKENAQHYAPPHPNGPVAGSSKQQAGTSKQQPGTSKQQAQQPKPVPTATPKESPPCNVPTNVLKSMAMKRHQDQADHQGVVSGESSAPAKANEAKPAKEGSKLAKRVQQKTAPKRTIGKKEKMDEKAKKAAVKQEAVPKMPIPDPASYLPVTADDIIEHDMQICLIYLICLLLVQWITMDPCECS
ncbi:AGAP003302-PA [Anopheles gambiae str. PEST]|uniref:AGAP003302-PA n=1 Tax=Anopheles gambiae TaxID=7165 RepID=Q7Q0I4_ANOGA|nr:AGAP003302-PA [Anopheles gambiae str. PEST]